MSQNEEQVRYCFFCNTPSNNTQGNHVLYCGMCGKNMCDNCRPNYPMRMKAMFGEKWEELGNLFRGR